LLDIENKFEYKKSSFFITCGGQDLSGWSFN